MNNQLSILIIDDQEICLEHASRVLQGFPYVGEVKGIQTPNEAFQLLADDHFDVVFLDIEMPETDGISLACSIRHQYPALPIVFVTGHTGYALESFQANPVDYIIKPLNIVQTERALRRVTEKGAVKKTSKIGVKVQAALKLVSTDEILFIEKNGRKSYLYLTNNEVVETSEGVAILEKKLRNKGFYRSHQSYLVAVEKVNGIEPDEFMNSYNLSFGGILPMAKLSKHKIKEFKSQLSYTC
ncbi:LytTR family DNA-binding domain-containing protein [Halobacillus sp. Marseille-Q1614]|uniref:LytR/AlgR family response regulator transcription factor n=1 Tax=Halobacillus sp. Marseille-Q1614 TaxID=2709134 RepID=UPI00156FB44F|nr:LytTR family DNA-binding domain-containing protein [Halobacillus sp. Marseille-Q1614]